MCVFVRTKTVFRRFCRDGERGFETNSGGHVELSRMSSFQVDRCFVSRKMFAIMLCLCLRRMTVDQGGGSGVEGPIKPDRKPDGGEDGENADQASEETSTKRDGEETLNPSSAASPGSAPTLSSQTPSPAGVQVNPTALSPVLAAPSNQDQHHFLRSSVRPPSKRIRKDASSAALNGHGGAKAKGEWPYRGASAAHLSVHPFSALLSHF